MSSSERVPGLQAPDSQLFNQFEPPDYSWVDSIGAVGATFLSTMALIPQNISSLGDRLVELWTWLTSSEEASVHAVAVADLSDLSGFEDMKAPNGDSAAAVQALFREETQKAAANLREDAPLSNATSESYIEFLKSQSGEKATFFTGLIHQVTYQGDFIKDTVMPEVKAAREEGKSFVFIPMVQKGMIDHMVLLTVNLDEGTFEYYDPKAHRGRSLEEAQLLSLNMNIADFQKQLATEMGAQDWKVNMTSVEHQKFGDTTNCGAFVSKFMKERLQSSLDAAESAIENPCAMREELAKDLEAQLN